MRRALLIVLVVLMLPAWAAADPRDSVSRDFPVYDNGGLPDLTVDPKRFVSQMAIIDREFKAGSCAIDEGTVGGSGVRRLLRFDTVVMNMGDGDLVVGDPRDPGNPYASSYEFAACHQHLHLQQFSEYRLLTADRSEQVLGRKQSFCFEDSLRYAGTKAAGYHCGYQGITSGWGDLYYKQLSGQWIDITGVPAGDYVLQVRINVSGTFDEGENRYPNVIEAPVRVPDSRNKVDGG